MKESLNLRGILIALVTLLCIFFYYFKTTPPYFNPSGNLKRGLDLKGGVHLLLLMNTDASIDQRVSRDINLIEGELKKKNIPYDNIYPSSEKRGAIVVIGKNPNLGIELKDFVDRVLTSYIFSSEGSGKYVISMKDSEIDDIRDRAIQQSVELIRTRIDRYGVAETAIHRQGLKTNKIVVEIPGVADSTEIKALIGKAAQLGWHLTLEPIAGASSKEAIINQYNGKIPEDAMIVPFELRGENNEQYYLLVKKVPIVTGADIKDVHVSSNQYGQPVVAFELTLDAGKKFREFTRNNIGNHAAILLDNVVISNPVIKDEIGERGVIEGNFTTDAARRLVLQLKSGSLPAIPEFGEERTVGPSLGLDAIRRGTISGIIGLLLIFIFMLSYYRGAGINAIVALILNFILIVGIMSTFGMTLTVPGIAGIILTLGMAVDANVLIYERIRDEINEGKMILTAIANGFSKAFITILDSNLTTIISGILLFNFGTGPIKGFAVTLIVGLLASMFTSVFVSRWLYDLVIYIRSKGGKVVVNSISIGNTKSFRGLKVQWMNYRYIFLTISLLLIAVGLVNVSTKGLNWGIDFRGGQEIEVKFTQKMDPRTLESQLRKKMAYPLTVVKYGDEEDNEILIRIEARNEKGELLSEEDLAKTLDKVREVLANENTLRGYSEGKVDLNNTTSQKVADLLSQGIISGELGGSLDQVKDIAESIMEVKKLHGGLISDFDILKESKVMNEQILNYLKNKSFLGNYSILRIDTVGPTIGRELKNKSKLLVFWSLTAMLLYIWFRFKLRFGVGALVALAHDALITIGLMSIFQVEVNIPAIAALLTLLGYSINDTIVLFDRVRENMQRERKDEDKELINRSINEVFSRTIITSFLTFIVVFIMLLLGGEAIHSFAFVLTWGIVVGTYSSIFIASPFVLFWNKIGIEKLLSRKKK